MYIKAMTERYQKRLIKKIKKKKVKEKLYTSMIHTHTQVENPLHKIPKSKPSKILEFFETGREV